MWRSRLSAALAAILIASTPLAAQEHETDWLRVFELRPGQVIALTIRSAEPGDRLFLAADRSRITVLNLTDPGLPRRVTDTLQQFASAHPEYFEHALSGEAIVAGNVRISSIGVFLGAGKVADLARIVEVIPRPQVGEIRTSRKGRGFWGHLGGIGGYLAGAMGGGMMAGLACHASAGSARCDSGAFMIGMVAGGAGGGLYGFAAANREVEEVIYRSVDPTTR